MSSPYYTPSGVPQTGSQGYSAVIRGEFINVANGFALLPQNLTPNCAVVINNGGSGMTTTTGALALAGNFITTGAFNTTLAQQGSVTLTLPATTDTLVGRATVDTLTNKTLSGAVASGTWTTSGTWTLPAVTLGGAITYGGVALSNAVTGTGSMVLSAAPTITGHPTIEGVTSTGATGTGNLVFASAPALTNPTATTQSTTDSSTKVATTAYVNNFLVGVYPYGNFSGAGASTIDTGISVNAGQPGLCLLAMCCLQNNTGNFTYAAIYMLRFHFDGNSAPAATQIALDAGSTGLGGFSFGVSGSNTLTITGPGGNWRVVLQGTQSGP